MEITISKYNKHILILFCWIFLLISDNNLFAGKEKNELNIAWSFHKESLNKDALKIVLNYLKHYPNSYKGNELVGRLFELRGNHKKTLHHWFKLLKLDHPLNYLYIKKITNTIISYPERQKAISLYLKLLHKTSYQPTKAILQYQLGFLYRQNGEIKKSKHFFKQLRWLNRWSILGPFDNDRNSGFNRSFDPEKEIKYSKVYQGMRTTILFRKLPFLDFNKTINLKPFFYPNKWVLAYGVTYIYSSIKQAVYLYAGASNGIKVWINDKLVLSHREKINFNIDQYKVKVSINQGWNKILFKSTNEKGGWRLALRLTTLSGKPISKLKFSDQLKPYQSDREIINELLLNETKVPWNIPAFLMNYLDLQPVSEKNYYFSLWYYQNHFRNKHVELLEKLIKNQSKSTYYWTMLGKAYHLNKNWVKGISAFKKAIKLDQANFLAHFNLGKYYYNKSLYDKSIDRFHILKADFDSNILTYYYLISLYNKKKWHYDAFLMAKKITKLNYNNYLSHRYLGDQYFKLQQWKKALYEYQLAIKNNFSNSNSRKKIYQLALQLDLDQKAIHSLKELISLYPATLKYRLQLGELFLKQKKYLSALKLFFRAKKISPHHSILNKKIGDTYYRMDNRTKSLYYYRLALTYKPENLDLREYLNFLSPKKHIFLKKYDLKDDNIKKIIASAPKIDTYPKSKGVILLKRLLIEVFKSGAYYYQYHYLIQISNQAGIKEFSQIDIPKKVEKLLKTVTHTSDGKELEAAVFEKGKISFPSLKVGSIIEYKYIVEKRSGEWLNNHFYKYFSFQSKNPILISELILSIPKSKKHKILVSNPNINQRKIDKENRWIYQWLSKDNAPIYKESFRPPFRNLTKKVMITTIPSWDRLTKWQQSLNSDQFIIDEAIKNKVLELIKNKNTLLEKIKAIFYYVSNEIHYLNNDVGIFGKLPNLCTTVFANQFGDCKDKTTFLIAMLKEIGVTAYYAGIRTSDRGELVREIPASQTNHIITYIPKQKGITKSFFVDSTSELYPFKYLRPDSQGVWAIVMKEKGYEFIKTPVYPSHRTLSKEIFNISFTDKGNLDVSHVYMPTGYYARKVRKKYKLKKKRKELLEKLFNKQFQGINQLKSEFTPLRDLDTPVKVKSHFTVKDFITVEKSLGESKLHFQAFYFFKLTSTFTSKEDREHDLEFRYSRRKEVIQNIKIPTGYILANKPNDFSFQLDNTLSYFIKYRFERETVIRTKVLTIEKGKIALSDYSKLRNLCIQADRADRTTLTFKPEQEKSK